MIRNIIGVLLLLAGALDIWKFGWALIVHSPQLLIGILLVAIGGGLLNAGGFKVLR